MKIVLDTNVLISGFITTTGVASVVLAKSFSRHEVLVSDYILAEFETKMVEKLKFSKPETSVAMRFLKSRCGVVNLAGAPKIDFSDKKDVPILELIAFANPNYFITGDKNLLALKKQGGTVFLSPREALEVI